MQPAARARTALALLVLLGLLAACTPGEDPQPDEETALTVAPGPGVTEEPCPEAVDDEHGCIYLGILSDLSVGPLAPTGGQLTDAQIAFWERVNAEGGIGGYEVDVETHLRDNAYDPEVHAAAFDEIRDDVLGLAQSLGSPQTAAILDELEAHDVLAVPASSTSAWAFEDVIVQSGASYCVEAMNALDYAFTELDDLETVMAIHYPGDYGDDAAHGVEVAAAAHDVDFVGVETPPGADQQADAIEAVLDETPDLVYITTGPLEMATIVGQAAARGFDGRVIGSGPTWDRGLLDSPAADALAALYWQASPWHTFTADTPGHAAMRDQLGDVTPNDAYTAGWVLQYPLKAALEAAVEEGALTRSGLRSALEDLSEVDYEGMLPAHAGRFDPGAPDEQAFRESVISRVNPESDTGLSPLTDFYRGPTAAGYELSVPCYEQG